MKTKLHKLKRMGKLSLSRGNRGGQNILDLGEGSFSGGCRKASGISANATIVLLLINACCVCIVRSSLARLF